METIISRYEDVGLPELHRIAGVEDEEWWKLYTRVTGVSKDDIGHFFGVMPSPDDLLSMRTLWVKDRFREGWTRSQVIAWIEGKR